MKPNNSIDQLVALASEIRRLTIKRLEAVPRGFINWQLNNNAMSFAHLIQHIINVDNLFFNLATSNNKTFIWVMGSEVPYLNLDEATYNDMLAKLKDYGIKRDAIISSFNDNSINELVSNQDGETITIWWFLMHYVLEHETYHRGQIAAYLKVLQGESTKA
tara:strand:- start:28605 stop:29087 length:483 start_codon:yes stop_codon:yes gene_type:complete